VRERAKVLRDSGAGHGGSFQRVGFCG
jgi:hypothetical protein